MMGFVTKQLISGVTSVSELGEQMETPRIRSIKRIRLELSVRFLCCCCSETRRFGSVLLAVGFWEFLDVGDDRHRSLSVSVHLQPGWDSGDTPD